jgi:hypothetical protein
VVFPGLDGSFSGVAAVLMGRNALEVDMVLLKCEFDVGGTLVIEKVKLWSVAVRLKFCEDT